MNTNKLPSRIMVEGLDGAPHRAFLAAAGSPLARGALEMRVPKSAPLTGVLEKYAALVGSAHRAAVTQGRKP